MAPVMHRLARRFISHEEPHNNRALIVSHVVYFFILFSQERCYKKISKFLIDKQSNKQRKVMYWTSWQAYKRVN